MSQSLPWIHLSRSTYPLNTVLLALALCLLPAHAKPPVLYEEAAARYEKAENAADAVAAGEWREISAALERFSERHPDSPSAGKAALRCITIAMDRLFDLDMASEAVRRAGLLPREPAGPDHGSVPSRVVPPWYNPAASFPASDLEQVLYECYVRAALVAHFRGEQGHALELLRGAGELEPPGRGRSGQRLTAVVRGWLEPLTPGSLLDAMEDGKQKTGVQLADLALTTFHPEWAMELYERLLSGADPLPEPSDRVESYLFLRMEHALQFEGRHEEAAVYRERRFDLKYAQYRWPPERLFSEGTRIGNATQSAEVPMRLWKLCFTKYPEYRNSERALFFYAITAQREKEYEVARWAFELYIERYPDSRWTQRSRRELSEVEELLEEAKQ